MEGFLSLAATTVIGQTWPLAATEMPHYCWPRGCGGHTPEEAFVPGFLAGLQLQSPAVTLTMG